MTLLRFLTKSGTPGHGAGSCGGMLLVMLAVSGLLTRRDKRSEPGNGPGTLVLHGSNPQEDRVMAMGLNSIMVGKSYRTPGDEVRTVQSIEGDEVVYQAACGATPAMIARATDRKCSLADFAAEVEAEVSPGV